MAKPGRITPVWGMAEKEFPTPEGAALAEWDTHPQAEARVVSVEYLDDEHAVVIADTSPSHPMWNHCERTPTGGWIFTHDHN